MVPVSAKTGMGLDRLLESVLLVTELKELKANPKNALRVLLSKQSWIRVEVLLPRFWSATVL